MLPLLFVGGPPLPLIPPPPIGNVLFGYSTRYLNPLYEGYDCRLRRISDSASSDFGFLAGFLDIAAVATFLGASSGAFETLYDQSVTGSSRNLSMNIAANRPDYVASGQNGKAVLRLNGTTQYLAYTGFDGNANALTLFLAANLVSDTGHVFHMSADGVNKHTFRLKVAPTTGNDGTLSFEITQSGGTDTLSAVVTNLFGTPHLFTVRLTEQGAYALRVDEVDVDTDTGSNAWAYDGSGVGLYLGARAGGAEHVAGDYFELIGYDVALTDDEMKSREGNIRSFWNIQ